MPHGYQHIWDGCCDHGLLGMSLLARGVAPHIHFVDIVPALIGELNARLKRFFPLHDNPASCWYTHCGDMAGMGLNKYEGKQLVILAGVGGDLMIAMLNRILSRHPQQPMDFLLCPVHHQYALRQALRGHNMHLNNEQLLADNGRYYEVLLVSPTAAGQTPLRKVSPVGDGMWQVKTAAQAEVARGYLTKTLSHYRRMLNSHPGVARPILNAYQGVQLSRG